ncbi:MAG TPA: hypothetical protein VN625_09195 [Desulfuromonadaceae bacterium]|nr:hypothetical protein [Desulfuromonadaceae bacterium]
MQNLTPSKPHFASKRRISPILLGLAAVLAAAVPMKSSAWTEFFPSSTLQVQDAGGTYHNVSGTTTSINFGDVRYSNSGGVETFQVVGLAQKRVERRYNDDYGSSVNRRWQGNVLFNSPSSGVTIHQLFNGSAGPHVLNATSSSSSGSLRTYGLTSSSQVVATGVYGVTFKLESKNWNTGTIQILVNGSLKLSGSRRSGTYYTKYGMYNPNAAQSIKFSSVHIYQ